MEMACRPINVPASSSSRDRVNLQPAWLRDPRRRKRRLLFSKRLKPRTKVKILNGVIKRQAREINDSREKLGGARKLVGHLFKICEVLANLCPEIPEDVVSDVLALADGDEPTHIYKYGCEEPATGDAFEEVN